MAELTVTSPLFERGGWMPDSCAGYGADLSPELRVDGELRIDSDEENTFRTSRGRRSARVPAELHRFW